MVEVQRLALGTFEHAADEALVGFATVAVVVITDKLQFRAQDVDVALDGRRRGLVNSHVLQKT